MYKHIIVAVDLSHGDAGKALIDKAKALVDAGGVIRLLHVLEDVPSYIAAELPRDLNDRRQAEAKVELGVMAEGADLVNEIRTGAPASQILQCAEDNGADLIMIASHRPGLSDYFIGSTAARVVRHAQCSVLISR
ncbi:MAG: universal stress protein [Rhodobacter sp.]|uniref:universal stress protein n=1 Tax=Pararhodobacter sp. TaxID=2127056 RepID=UPI001DC2A99D|nr:universal stress protein [Pararhodobacter sp.]MCB1346691.1 universal stress protein [Paracoccaceae bacterium]MCC0073021.1 universal stress protein [Rhodobacter sp.]HPD91956.1 universal stress protein [Pararhodobacter sp.]